MVVGGDVNGEEREEEMRRREVNVEGLCFLIFLLLLQLDRDRADQRQKNKNIV